MVHGSNDEMIHSIGSSDSIGDGYKLCYSLYNAAFTYDCTKTYCKGLRFVLGTSCERLRFVQTYCDEYSWYVIYHVNET